MAASMSLCSFHLFHPLKTTILKLSSSKLFSMSKASGPCKSFHRLKVNAITEGSAKSRQSEEAIPSWAKPNSEEPPPWASNESKDGSEQTFEIPYYAYLLASTVVAIAAIGSIFEYANQKPVFGVIYSDNAFYAPLLGFFALAGFPTSAFLWFKSVKAANKEAEEQDKKDGYL